MLVDRIAPLHLDNERALLGSLAHEEQQTLAGLLRKLLIAYEHQQPTRPQPASGDEAGASRGIQVLADNAGMTAIGMLLMRGWPV